MRLLSSLLLAAKAHESVHDEYEDSVLEEEKIIESSWDDVNEVWIDHDLDEAEFDIGIELI